MKRSIIFALAACMFALTAWSPGATSGPPVLPETDKLLAFGSGTGAQFGYAVDLDGQTLVVGSRSHNAAWIFERDPGDPGQWLDAKRLVPGDGEVNNAFGRAVALSGDTIVVGAPNDSEACSPDPCSAGAVYVYERDQGGADNWGEIKKVKAGDATALAAFGTSLDLDGDTLVVGAPGDDVNGEGFGSVYVLERSLVGPLWGESKKLRASDAESGGEFGAAIDLDSDTLIVGAIGGVTGGAGYVFGRDRDGVENWGEIEKVVRVSVDSSVSFGAAVAISGDIALIGAPRDDEACAQSPGVDCNSGAAHLFERNQGGAENWGEVVKLTASDFITDARFGNALALAPGVAVVGAFMDNEEGVRSGSAYLFLQGLGGPADWTEAAKLQASDREAGDQLGHVVATDGPAALVGSPMSPDVCCGTGAAYVFELQASPLVIFVDGFEDGGTSAWSVVVGKEGAQ